MEKPQVSATYTELVLWFLSPVFLHLLPVVPESQEFSVFPVEEIDFYSVPWFDVEQVR